MQLMIKMLFLIIQGFLDMTPCWLVNWYRHFRGAHYINLQSLCSPRNHCRLKLLKVHNKFVEERSASSDAESGRHTDNMVISEAYW